MSNTSAPAVIGEETLFTGRAVAAIVAALMFLAGGALGIYERLGSIDTRIAKLEQRVGDLAAQHAQREQKSPPTTATASNP